MSICTSSITLIDGEVDGVFSPWLLCTDFTLTISGRLTSVDLTLHSLLFMMKNRANIHVFHLFSFLFSFFFLAALGLCCCTRAFSGCGEQGLLFVAVRGLHIAVVSLVAEHGL